MTKACHWQTFEHRASGFTPDKFHGTHHRPPAVLGIER